MHIVDVQLTVAARSPRSLRRLLFSFPVAWSLLGGENAFLMVWNRRLEEGVSPLSPRMGHSLLQVCTCVCVWGGICLPLS